MDAAVKEEEPTLAVAEAFSLLTVAREDMLWAAQGKAEARCDIAGRTRAVVDFMLGRESQASDCEMRWQR